MKSTSFIETFYSSRHRVIYFLFPLTNILIERKEKLRKLYLLCYLRKKKSSKLETNSTVKLITNSQMQERNGLLLW